MSQQYFFRLFLFTAILSLSRIAAFAQTDQIERVWYNEEKTARIQVYKAKNNWFYGKIIWLKEPNANGKPRTDINNPNDQKKLEPLMGSMVLKAFKKDGDKGYTGGTIYDPKNGKTYDCTITYKGTKLNLRGYIGISLIGRTTIWTIAD